MEYVLSVHFTNAQKICYCEVTDILINLIVVIIYIIYTYVSNYHAVHQKNTLLCHLYFSKAGGDKKKRTPHKK